MSESTSARTPIRTNYVHLSRLLCGLVLATAATADAQMRHSSGGSAPSMRSAAPQTSRHFSGHSGLQNGGDHFRGATPQMQQPIVNYSQADLPGQSFAGHQHYGNNFSSGGFYGGIPYALPPVYVRNRDQAVFFPPLIGGNSFYGYGNDLWYGGNWPSYNYFGYRSPYYSSCFGSVGFLPTYGYCSSAWQSFGVFPSLLNVNLTSSRASFSRTVNLWAVPTQVDEYGDSRSPRMRVTPPPAAGEFPFDLPVAPESAPLPQSDFNQIPVPAGASAIPMIDEFPPIARSEKTSSLTQRIHSLRYQSSGDDAFRRSDYPTAEVFYRSAIESAPDRRAPWFRMAFAHLARQQFDTATAHLKTGLLLRTDISRAWITAAELYGPEGSARIPDQAMALWDWAAEEPLSTDRLLLTAAFQILRGDNASADELLSLAGHNGPEEALLAEMRQVAADDAAFRSALTSPFSGTSGLSTVAVNAVHDEFRPAPTAVDPAGVAAQQTVSTPADSAATSTATNAHVEGIFMRGRRAHSSAASDAASKATSQSGLIPTSAVGPVGQANNVTPLDPEPLRIPPPPDTRPVPPPLLIPAEVPAVP